MKYLRVTSFETNRPLALYVYTDTHIGNVGFDEKLLKEHIQLCKKDKRARWVHLGDWAEAITPNDRRFDIRATDELEDPELGKVLRQYEHAEKLFKPIAKQGLALLSGNHDDKLAKESGDYIAQLGRRLNIPYLRRIGYLDLKVMGQYMPTLLWHGSWGGEMRGAVANRMHRLSHKFDARLYLAGHWHRYDPYIDELLFLLKGKTHTMKRYYVACPSYFDTYSDGGNYAQDLAMYPQPHGCVRLKITDKDVKIEPLLGDER